MRASALAALLTLLPCTIGFTSQSRPGRYGTALRADPAEPHPGTVFRKVKRAPPAVEADAGVVWDDETEATTKVPQGERLEAGRLPDFMLDALDEGIFLDESQDDRVLDAIYDEDMEQLKRADEDAGPAPTGPTTEAKKAELVEPEPRNGPQAANRPTDEAMLFDRAVLVTREQGWLGDSTLENIAEDYGFPLDFIFEALGKWGVPPPIPPQARLGDLVTADQAYALLEALHTLDRSDVHDDYVNETVAELADMHDASIAEVFQICGQSRLNLSNGLDTRLAVADYKILCKVMGWPVPEAYSSR